MPDPDPSTLLSGIRERAEKVRTAPALSKARGWACIESARDVPALLKAAEAVLKPHQPGTTVIFGSLCKRHENHRYFSITRTEADAVRSCPDCTATVYTSCTGCGNGVSMDACPVREAISRELTGKETGSDAPV